MANTAHNTLFEIKDPHLATNSEGFVIAAATVLSILAAIELFFFGSILYYRKHTVMQLSQCSLLAVMVAAATLATVFSFLIIPVNDLRCYLKDPLIFTPVTLVGVILLCRIWRVNSILAPAARIGNKGKKKNPFDLILMDILGLLSECNPMTCYRAVCVEGRKCTEINFHLSFFGRKGKNPFLRRSISIENVVWLIAVLMLPQVILQICNLAVPALKMHFGYEMNEPMTVGKCACLRQDMWSFYLGGVFALIPFIITLLLAFFTRDLPSLFNESNCIFSTARLIFVVLAVGMPLLVLADDPTVSPNVTVSFLSTV